ncbi:MAG: MMPL family transporter [Candidatus Kariarchaeaceae archaeon]|jgi:RND superfamily putative drug exporter
MTDEKKQFNGFRSHYITLIIWLVLFSVTISGSARLSESIESAQGFLDEGTESGSGTLVYEERFNITGDVSHIIVVHGEGIVFTSPEWRQFIFALSSYLNDTLITQNNFKYDSPVSEPILLLSGIPGIEDVASSLLSEDKHTALINIGSSVYNFEDDQAVVSEHIPLIRDLLADFEGLLAYANELPPLFSVTLPTLTAIESLHILLTGPVANFVDTIEVTEESFRESEVISVILVIIVLALVFRSPLGIAIPIVGMVVALTPTFMVAFLLGKAGLFQISDFLPSMISMIGIAVAVDYNLFSLVRFREEFRKRKARHELNGTWTKENIKIAQIESAKRMNATAGQAVMYSGITVIIGFMSMLVIGSDFSKSMSISIAVMVIFSILTARTLTPAILSIWGNKLDWPNFLSRAKQDVEKQKNEISKNVSSKSFWLKWSDQVMKYPIAFLLLGLLILGPFIVLSANTQLSFDTLKSLPSGTESRHGLEHVQNDFNLGTIYPYQVIIDTGEGGSIFQSQIIDAANAFAQWAYTFSKRVDGTDIQFTNINSLSFSVNSSGHLNTMDLDTINGILASNQSVFFTISTGRYANFQHGSNALVMNIGTNLDPGTGTAWDLTEDIRKQVRSIFKDVDGVIGTYVTGFSASFLDTNDSLYSDVPLMIAVAVILIYIALLVLFRSVILPAKAILTIGGSILFGLGTLVFVLQEGNLLHISIFDIDIWKAEQTGVAFIIPIFLFTTVLGLGMDYSIFIITRINEEYHRNGKSINEAVGLGLSKTAGVITSAATIMTVTFLVFAASPTMIMKSIGLALSVSIIVDATISRVLLLPAAMRLAGKWNWYLPKWLDKILPKIELDH